MRDMRVYPDTKTGETLLAAGTIIVGIQLPLGLDSLKLDVGRLLPDVLVFDGRPSVKASNLGSEPSDVTADIVLLGKEAFPPPPLPSPLPPTTFARIRPRYWLDSKSVVEPDRSSPGKTVTMVTAHLKDVPLEILPHRDAVFRGFIQKVIFKGSAVAGVRGNAAVGATIEGLALANGTEMELRNIPFEGAFTISRGGVKKVVETL